MSYFCRAVLFYCAISSLLSLWVSKPAFGVECGNSLFPEDSLAAEVKDAKNRFQSLTRSFKPDNNVDIIFEVPIEDRSVAEIEQIVTDGKSNYFGVANNSLSNQADGFSQQYDSADGEWTKTIKVTTHDFQGRSIIPYIQIFYEDKQGGVIRLKPFGNTAAPAHLSHLRSAHGTLYFKKDPNGDLNQNKPLNFYLQRRGYQKPRVDSVPTRYVLYHNHWG